MSDSPCRTGRGKEGSAALSAVFENYLKVIKLNVITGEFRLIKTCFDSFDKGAEAFASFYEYAEAWVREGVIHKDDSEIFLRYLDPEYLLRKLSGGRHIMLHGLRYRIFGRYRPLTMEITALTEFSLEKPWVIMCIACPEKLRSPVSAVLDRAFCKIVFARLSDGYYEPVYMSDSEISEEQSLVPGMDNWFASFVQAGNVFEEDREKFLSFIDTENLRRLLEANKEARLAYRRRIGSEYRPVNMEIVRSTDISADDSCAFIYIYEEDPRNEHLTERDNVRRYFGFSDLMTGTRSRQCYEELCREYESEGRKEPVGVMYADLIFEDEDREAIRESLRIFALLLMETFGRERTFRLGETEFAAVSFGGDGESFRRKAARFCSEYRQNVNHKLMTGISRNEAAESITMLMELCREFAAADESFRKNNEY